MKRRLGLAAAAAVASLLLWVPVASAAPPANDNFVDAESLGLGVPVEIARTNAEATKETEEPHHGLLGSSGHSVWFEWEATATEFVTVGTCGSEFATEIGIYTGAAVNALTPVADDYLSEGPGCLAEEGGDQITFEAIGGTTYAIADGDPFFVPPAELPIGEGSFDLQIEATPTPPNDNFVDAVPLSGTTFEEEGSPVAIHVASARGFNWNATNEIDEPDHNGDQGGASVWYEWTAPQSGPASAGSCAGKPLVAGVYTGPSVDALVPVGSNEFPCGVSFPASAGTTYFIAIDGVFDADDGGPTLSSFSVTVTLQFPAAPRGDPPAQGSGSSPDSSQSSTDSSPPNAVIGRTSLRASNRSASFVFSSTESGSTFRCRLDGRPIGGCSSPKTYKSLKPGTHVFRVWAVDAAGNVDPSPAVSRFQVVKPRAKKRRKG